MQAPIKFRKFLSLSGDDIHIIHRLKQQPDAFAPDLFDKHIRPSCLFKCGKMITEYEKFGAIGSIVEIWNTLSKDRYRARVMQIKCARDESGDWNYMVTYQIMMKLMDDKQLDTMVDSMQNP